MKRIKILIGSLALLAVAASCSKQDGKGQNGSVSFSIPSNYEIAEVTKGSVRDYTSSLPSASDFTITIKDGNGAQVWSGLVSAWDPATALEVGNYSVSASFGEEGIEGFDKPYFVGNANFSVAGNQNTEVTIPVTLANSLVKVACTDDFKSYFTDYNFVVTTGSNNVIEFPASETRAAFIDAYKFSISGTLTSQGGSTKSFSTEYSNLDAATCYTVKFDASGIGGVHVTISFNDNVETVDCGESELNE